MIMRTLQSFGNYPREYQNFSQRQSRLLRTREALAKVRRRCSEILNQRKQAKFQWLQDPSKIIGDTLNNIRREVSRHFRNKKREYLKENLMNLQLTLRTRILETCIEE
jgi:hypothetical protein